jgi:hypothetical protein
MTASDKDIYEVLCALMAQQIPGFKVAYKDKSLFMKVLAVLTKLWCPNFMTDYVTTIGKTVYVPTESFVAANYSNTWKVLSHEFVHLVDSKQHPISYFLGYVFPQALAVLALGALGAFWSPWFLLALVFLVAAAPWASPGRLKWELRGYTMSMAVCFWQYGNLDPFTDKWIADNDLSGWGYYKMCWSQTKAEALIKDAASRISDGSVLLEAGPNPYMQVYNLLKNLNALANLK